MGRMNRKCAPTFGSKKMKFGTVLQHQQQRRNLTPLSLHRSKFAIGRIQSITISRQRTPECIPRTTMFSSPSANACVGASPAFRKSPKTEKPNFGSLPPNAIPIGRNCSGKFRQGNLYHLYRQIIVDNTQNYRDATSKRRMSESIARLCLGRGIRFVRWIPHSGGWEEQSFHEITNKVSSALRELANPRNCRKPIAQGKPQQQHEVAKVVPNTTVTSSATSASNADLSRGNRRSSRIAASRAVAAITKSAKNPTRLISTQQIDDSTSSTSLSKPGKSTNATLTRRFWVDLVAQLPHQGREISVRIVHSEEAGNRPPPFLGGNVDASLYPAGATVSNLPLQPVCLMPLDQDGNEWNTPWNQSHHTIYSQSYSDDSSASHVSCSKHSCIEPEHDMVKSPTPMSPPSLQRICQEVETASSFNSIRFAEGIFATISRSDDQHSTTAEGSPHAEECNHSEECESSSLLLFTPNTYQKSATVSDPWWTGMETDQSPFLHTTNSLFDDCHLEPSSPLSLPTTLQLFSDFDAQIDDSRLSSRSSGNSSRCSLSPCRFDTLNDININDDSTCTSAEKDTHQEPQVEEG